MSIAPESALEKAGCFCCWFCGCACVGAGLFPEGCDDGAPLGDAELPEEGAAGVGDEAFPAPELELAEDDAGAGGLLPPAELDDVSAWEDVGGALDGADALVSLVPPSLALVLASELLAES